MIKIENVDVFGWEASIRGMRNPMNSWDKSDSYPAVDCGKCGEIDRNGICYPKEHACSQYECFEVGDNDIKLMKNLSKAGNDHGKYLRYLIVQLDITAPLYWWKEFDTYKVGTVANSCSTMHKIHSKEFELEDFSHEHLCEWAKGELECVIEHLNHYRYKYNNYEVNEGYTKKDCWWQMIQLLPSSYNQKRTVQLNYQVLKSMYHARKNHKLDEWIDFCKWCETLPYFKEICIE